MMNEFKKEVVNALKEAFPKCRVEERIVDKINTKLHAISVANVNDEVVIGPTIYLENYIDRLDKGKSCIINEIIATISCAMDNQNMLEQVEKLKDKEFIMNNVVFCLINTAQNKELLEKIPNRKFGVLDLSIVYKVMVESDKSGIATLTLTNEYLRGYNVSEEELYNAAIGNTARLNIVVKSIAEVIAEACGMVQSVDNVPMYVISNEIRHYGAASLLYEEHLHMLAEKVDDDLLIIPSSIHEIIAVPASLGNAEYLSRLVFEVNSEQVELAERLSNNVNHYDRISRKVTIASNNPKSIGC